MALWQEVEAIRKELDYAMKLYRQNGIAFVEAENEYRIAKSKEILRLRDEGYPVTLIPDIVKGIDYVAELNLKRMAAEVVYKANHEAIQVKKLEMRTLESELEREYGNDNN